MRPLRRNRRAPGELYAPNVVVSKGGSESRDQLTRLQHEFIESVAICSNNPGPLQISVTRFAANRARDLIETLRGFDSRRLH